MKKIFLLNLMLAFTAIAFCQTNSGDVVGRWLSESGKAKIEIFETGGKFYGKIVWLKNPLDENGVPKVDKNNPKPEKRSIKLIGLLMVKSLEFDGKGTWQNGTIYDPENGKDYKCKVTKTTEGKLEIRGYIGVSVIGRTTTWSQAE